MRPDEPVRIGGGIRCAEAIELVTLHLDDALDDRDRRLFDGHVDGCTGCTRYVAQIRRTIELTGRVLAHTSVATPPRYEHLQRRFRSVRSE